MLVALIASKIVFFYFLLCIILVFIEHKLSNLIDPSQD